MKSRSPSGLPFAQEFHEFLITHFDGYTVASGNITGYWRRARHGEECNEHRQYQVALKKRSERLRLEKYLADLATQLGEETIFCQFGNEAFLISARS